MGNVLGVARQNGVDLCCVRKKRRYRKVSGRLANTLEFDLASIREITEASYRFGLLLYNLVLMAWLCCWRAWIACAAVRRFNFHSCSSRGYLLGVGVVVVGLPVNGI